MENKYGKDRAIFKNNMAIARAAEQLMKRQRRELGLPEPPLKIGNISYIDFKKK